MQKKHCSKTLQQSAFQGCLSSGFQKGFADEPLQATAARCSTNRPGFAKGDGMAGCKTTDESGFFSSFWIASLKGTNFGPLADSMVDSTHRPH